MQQYYYVIDFSWGSISNILDAFAETGWVTWDYFVEMF